MKTIKLRTTINQQTDYTILLGNGNKLIFTSKRAWIYGVADLQRNLTRWFVECNEIYIELYVNYRRAWLITSNHITGLNYKSEYTIKNNLAAACEKLDLIFLKPSHDAYMIFIELKKVCHYLIIVTQSLQDLYHKKSAVNYYGAFTLNKRLLSLITEVNGYDSSTSSVNE